MINIKKCFMIFTVIIILASQIAIINAETIEDEVEIVETEEAMKQVDVMKEIIVEEPLTEENKEVKVKYFKNKEFIDVIIPSEYLYYIDKYSNIFNIDENILKLLIYKESRYIPDVINEETNCYGLCQIKKSCHIERINKYSYISDDILDPELNIIVACDYLRELLDTTQEDYKESLLQYTGGDSKYVEYVLNKTTEENKMDNEEKAIIETIEQADDVLTMLKNSGAQILSISRNDNDINFKYVVDDEELYMNITSDSSEVLNYIEDFINTVL